MAMMWVWSWASSISKIRMANEGSDGGGDILAAKRRRRPSTADTSEGEVPAPWEKM